MPLRIVFTLLLALWPLLTFSQSQPVRTVESYDLKGTSHQYYIDLLSEILRRTAAEYGPAHVETVPHPGQGRVIRLLEQDRFFDVMWAGISEQREQNLKVIPIPLLKGGLGWRGMVIREQDREKFRGFTQLTQLKRLIGCQGEHWPDADILEHAGLTVARISSVTAMMEMLLLKRCDYLSLSLFEGYVEVAARQPKLAGLVFEDQVILKYPLAMYYFVHRSNLSLADRLTKGLTDMVEEGALLDFMQQHPVTRHVFPLTKYRHARIFELEAPAHTDSPLLQHSDYWLASPQ